MRCCSRICALIFVIAYPFHALAQFTADTLGVPPRQSAVDTSGGGPEARVISGRADTLKPTYHPARSPGLAMGLSAILPGAGQVYNGSYWKAPIVMGLGVYFISSWLDNNRRYLDYARQYAASLSSPTPTFTNLLALREFYRDERDTFSWYFFVLYLVNIADAYVDASLYDFNVGGDLSLRLMPVRSTLPDRSPQMQLQLTF